MSMVALAGALMLLPACGRFWPGKGSTPATPSPATAAGGTATPEVNPADEFVGLWVVGAGNNQGDFVLKVRADHTASQTWDAKATGTWEIVGGELQIQWSNGWKDVLRKHGSSYVKEAYKPGAGPDDLPNNVTKAAKQD